MSPLADPSLPVYARVVLAVLVIAMLMALAGALAALMIGTDHPVRILIQIGATLAMTAIGKIWAGRRARHRSSGQRS